MLIFVLRLLCDAFAFGRHLLLADVILLGGVWGGERSERPPIERAEVPARAYMRYFKDISDIFCESG
jgi:hypothetical protein